MIGMKARAMLPLIIFDAIVNLYLTLLFVLPLRTLYSYKNSPNSTLRVVALRSFVGSLATLASSVVNLTVLMVLKGEAAWICLMCCNADILFSVLVLHWVTSKDSNGNQSSDHSVSLQHVSAKRNTNVDSHSDPRSPISVPGKMEPFGGGFGNKGLRVMGMEDATVTTHISAREMQKGADVDEEEIYGLESGGGGKLRKGVEKLHVTVAQVVEMESGPRSEHMLGARSDDGEDGVDGVRRGSRGGNSTDDLVDRV